MAAMDLRCWVLASPATVGGRGQGRLGSHGSPVFFSKRFVFLNFLSDALVGRSLIISRPFPRLTFASPRRIIIIIIIYFSCNVLLEI